jgi:hypothetical protein
MGITRRPAESHEWGEGMCGLCGLFEGETHWTEADRAASAAQPLRQGRYRRVALANRILRYYHLSLSDWHGSKYLLSSPTGATEIVENIAAQWPAAERLARRQCDPLDRDLLHAIEEP